MSKFAQKVPRRGHHFLCAQVEVCRVEDVVEDEAAGLKNREPWQQVQPRVLRKVRVLVRSRARERHRRTCARKGAGGGRSRRKRTSWSLVLLLPMDIFDMDFFMKS